MKIECYQGDLGQIKKLFELLAIEARRLGPMMLKILLNPIDNQIRDVTGDREWRTAEIPSSNCHGNARSIAKIASILACGGELDGKMVISKETTEKIFEEQIYDIDLFSLQKRRRGLGVNLPSKETPYPHQRAGLWGGTGGSFMIMDLKEKMGIGYAVNQVKSPNLIEICLEKIRIALYKPLGMI